MKKLFFIAVMALASVAAFAQNEVGHISIQPKIGLNFASLTNYGGDANCRVGFVIGAEAEYQVSNKFSVAGAMLYSQQGTDATAGNATGTIKLDYINVPIIANIYAVGGLALKLGIQPGFAVNKKIKAMASGESVETGLGVYGVDINTFAFSIPIGASYEYNNFVLDARYLWGLTKIASGSNCKNSVFQITLGYKFKL